MIVETAGEAKEESDVLQLIAQHYKAIGIKLVIKPSDRTVMRNRAYSGEAMMTAWSGWDTGIPTADMSPGELGADASGHADLAQMGQSFRDERRSPARRPDLAAAKELLTLDAAWNGAKTPAERKAAWEKMLAIHAEQQFIIGTVSGVMQPIVVNATIAQCPERRASSLGIRARSSACTGWTSSGSPNDFAARGHDAALCSRASDLDGACACCTSPR